MFAPQSKLPLYFTPLPKETQKGEHSDKGYFYGFRARYSTFVNICKNLAQCPSEQCFLEEQQMADLTDSMAMHVTTFP